MNSCQPLETGFRLPERTGSIAVIPSWLRDVDMIFAGLIVLSIVALLLGDEMQRRKSRRRKVAS